MSKKKAKVRVNGRTLTTPTFEGEGVISRLEETLVKWITRDTVLSGDIDNITDKIRLGIRISAFRMALERLRQLVMYAPKPEPIIETFFVDSGIQRSRVQFDWLRESKALSGIHSVPVNLEFILGAAVDPSQVVFLRCANMTEERFGKASLNSPNNYDLILHLGSRNDFEEFVAYRASENFKHPVIFKGKFKDQC